jgi:transglutaminase-like putative cysteine protease
MYPTSPLNLPSALNTSATLHGIPSGVSGTFSTLKLMWLLVRKGKVSMPIRRLAQSLIADVQQKDFTGEVERLHRFVRDEIRYTKDINGVETLHDAEHVLAYKQGDCDDKSILLASLLESIGHPARLVAIGFNPGQYCHVYVETLIGKKYVPLETTEPVEMGWESPRRPLLRMVYPPMKA